MENTSLGTYHGRRRQMFVDDTLTGKALCSACTPAQFRDGSATRCAGKWHGRFTKTIATEEEVIRLGLGYFTYLGPFAYLHK